MHILIANHDLGGMNAVSGVFDVLQAEGHQVDFVVFKKNANRLQSFSSIPESNVVIADEFPPAAAERLLKDGHYDLVIASLDELAGVPDDRPAWGTVSKNALCAAKKRAISTIGYLDSLYRPDDIVSGSLITLNDMYLTPDIVAVQTQASFSQVRRLRPDLRVEVVGPLGFDALSLRLNKYRSAPTLATALGKKISEAYGLNLSQPIVCYSTSELAHSFRHPDVEIEKRTVEISSGQAKIDAQLRLDAMLEDARRTARKVYGYTDTDITDLINEALGTMGEYGNTVQRVIRPHPKEDSADVQEWASAGRYALIREGYKITGDEYIDFAALAAQRLIPGENVNLTNVFANTGMAVELYILAQGMAKIVTDPLLSAGNASEFLKAQGMIPDVHTSQALASLIQSENGSSKEFFQNTSPEVLSDKYIFNDCKNARQLAELVHKI